MKFSIKVALCIGMLGGIAAMAAGPDWEALGKRWWAHVQFLADDKLEGRDTGSAGFEIAAAYVTGQFKQAGLRPAGLEGYAQPVEFIASQINESESSLELLRDGKAEPVKLGEDGFLTVNQDTAKETEADAVFVGYGLTVPELKYDDLAGQNLKGKIAVFVSGGPATMPGPLKAHYQSQEERRRAMFRAGAAGIATIQNPKAVEVPWSRTAGARFEPRMELSEAGARRMADKPLPHFPLAVRIRARVSKENWQVKSENLAGLLPGSDAALGKEYVVVSAHLDHIGIGEPVNGDKIYNGAMDDASGIASLIEVARAMKESGAKPKRSILFLAVTGEEKGLLGSRYFAEHPTVNAKSIVADLNMDMFLPLFPLKYLEVQGLGESTLGDDIRAVCQEAGVQVQADKMPDNNRFIRSDQYSFIRRGVPALAFKFGWVPGSPEEKVFKDWYKERYHGPADDVNQPVDLAGAAQFDAILGKLLLRVADAEQRPKWKEDSFFRRFAQ